MSKKTQSLIEKFQAKWVDLRFTDTKGKEQHMTLPVHRISEDLFTSGTMFDGSSISGWKGINKSDMILLLDDDTAVVDPFAEKSTIIVRCDVIEPDTGEGYTRDPRSVAKRAEAYLKQSKLGDSALFGPEPEFFVFDSVTWQTNMSGAFYNIDCEEAPWSTVEDYEEGNAGHRPRVKGGYFPVPPVDSLHDLRSDMCDMMAKMGLNIEVHHHEVGGAGQCEIGVGANTLVKKADEIQILKYCVHNVAHLAGKTATFMPKPLMDDNGSGMHVHQSFSLNGINQFAGDEYAGLSKLALYYIGGIIKHAHAINAFANSATNSYKRLVPGFEAPTILAYSARNRSAAIRIPYVTSPKAKRIEVRFPDAAGNPYFTFAAMLLAGLDGIQNRIEPGPPADINLYDLTSEELTNFSTISTSLEQSLTALSNDREFLLAGDVFSNDTIDAYIALKNEEVERFNSTPHPIEFDMYYSV